MLSLTWRRAGTTLAPRSFSTYDALNKLPPQDKDTVVASPKVVKETKPKYVHPVPEDFTGSTEPAPPLEERFTRKGPAKTIPKRGTYFAIRVGREVGVFKSWDLAQRKVLNYPGAHFRKFARETSAKNWLDGGWMNEEPKLDSTHVPAPLYVLNFASKPDKNIQGKTGMGWVLRKLPENELILAGWKAAETKDLVTSLRDLVQGDMDEFAKKKSSLAQEEASKVAADDDGESAPYLKRKRPIATRIPRGLGPVPTFVSTDIVRFGTATEALKHVAKAFNTGADKKRLPFPLSLEMDSSIVTGLLSGSKSVVPELKKAKDVVLKLLPNIADKWVAKQISKQDNQMALILASVALTRKHDGSIPQGKIIGSVTVEKLVEVLSVTPDMSSKFVAAVQPGKEAPIAAKSA